MRSILPRAATLAGLFAVLLLTACASGPQRSSGSDTAGVTVAPLGQRVAQAALAQVGLPYRYGGNGPDSFDCSGLVRFAYAAQGITVPRTTTEQLQAARPVTIDALAPGDLLFFRFDGPKVSHVAIYAGDGRFVHAPQSGRSVETRYLDDPGYRRQLVGAGRLH